MVVAMSVAESQWAIPSFPELLDPWIFGIRAMVLRDVSAGCEVLTMTSRLSERGDLLDSVTRSPSQGSVDSWIDLEVVYSRFDIFTRDLLVEVEVAGARKTEITLQKECSVWHSRAEALR